MSKNDKKVKILTEKLQKESGKQVVLKEAIPSKKTIRQKNTF